LCRLRRQARKKERKRGHLALRQGDCVPLHPLLKSYGDEGDEEGILYLNLLETGSLRIGDGL